MGVSRISSTFMVDQGIYNVQNNLSLLNQIQERISTGKNIHAPSDDPVGLTQLLRLNLGLNDDDRLSKNIDDALGELGAADVSMTGIVNVTQRVNELAVQAANGTNSPAQLDAIATELDSLTNQLTQLGNTTFAGRYIFSGFKTDTSPFVPAAGGTIAYNGSPNTSPAAYERSVEIAKGSTMPVNVNGDDLLGDVTVTPAPPGPSVITGQGLLKDITQLKQDLQTRNFAGIRTGVDAILADQQKVLQLQTTIGGRTNQLEMTKNRLEDRKTIQSQGVANIQEVNMPDAISNLNFQQNIYQASLGAMSKIMDTSILNFLK